MCGCNEMRLECRVRDCVTQNRGDKHKTAETNSAWGLRWLKPKDKRAVETESQTLLGDRRYKHHKNAV